MNGKLLVSAAAIIWCAAIGCAQTPSIEVRNPTSDPWTGAPVVVPWNAKMPGRGKKALCLIAGVGQDLRPG